MSVKSIVRLVVAYVVSLSAGRMGSLALADGSHAGVPALLQKSRAGDKMILTSAANWVESELQDK
jgi:hypothetical protein